MLFPKAQQHLIWWQASWQVLFGGLSLHPGNCAATSFCHLCMWWLVWSNNIFVSLFLWCLKMFWLHRKWRVWLAVKNIYFTLGIYFTGSGYSASGEALGVFQVWFPKFKLIPWLEHLYKQCDFQMCWIAVSPLGLSMNCSLLLGIQMRCLLSEIWVSWSQQEAERDV